MGNVEYAECYAELANAIVLQAFKDYRKALFKLVQEPEEWKHRSSKKKLERFFHSKWYRTLTDLDPAILMQEAKRQADINVIHYGFIEKIIEELGNTYHIREIAFDRWGAVQMTQNLEGLGFTVVPFGQGFKDMSPPTKEFYKLLMEGRIVHGGNPIMAWMAGNVVVDTDPAGNIKPTKAKSPEKIDGIVAAIMALDRCIRNEGQQQGSIYDERDMIVF